MDIIEKFFRLIVGKSRIAYRKDVIRHLEELKVYYDKRGFYEVVDNIDKEIRNQYTKLSKLEDPNRYS